MEYIGGFKSIRHIRGQRRLYTIFKKLGHYVEEEKEVICSDVKIGSPYTRVSYWVDVFVWLTGEYVKELTPIKFGLEVDGKVGHISIRASRRDDRKAKVLKDQHFAGTVRFKTSELLHGFWYIDPKYGIKKFRKRLEDSEIIDRIIEELEIDPRYIYGEKTLFVSHSEDLAFRDQTSQAY